MVKKWIKQLAWIPFFIIGVYFEIMIDIGKWGVNYCHYANDFINEL